MNKYHNLNAIMFDRMTKTSNMRYFLLDQYILFKINVLRTLLCNMIFDCAESEFHSSTLK